MHCKIIYAKNIFCQQYRFFIPEVRGLFLKNNVSAAGEMESGAVAMLGEVDILYYVYMSGFSPGRLILGRRPALHAIRLH